MEMQSRGVRITELLVIMVGCGVVFGLVLKGVMFIKYGSDGSTIGRRGK